MKRPRHALPRPSAAACLVLSLGLLVTGGCASTGTPVAGSTAAPAWTGTVQSIQETGESGGWQGIVGSLSGTVLGALLGSAIGGGVGTTIATVVTSGLGAAGGQELGSRLGAKPVYRVTIRGTDGIDRTVKSEEKPNFQLGATVSLDANGKLITP